MEIVRWDDTKSGLTGTMVRVTRLEALELIQSLTVQLISSNPNNDRSEHTATTKTAAEYFSIAVMSPLANRECRPDLLGTDVGNQIKELHE